MGLKPSLSQVKVKKKDKISDKFGLFLCLTDQIDYDIVNLQQVTYDVIKITSPKIRHQNASQNFSIFKPLP